MEAIKSLISDRLKKYSRYSAYLLTEDAGGRLLSFFAMIYLARILEVRGFGLITIGTAFLSYGLLISDAGLRMSGFLELSRTTTPGALSGRMIAWSKALQASLSFVLLCGFVLFLYPDHEIRTICMLYLLNILYDGFYIDWYFRAKKRFKTISIVKNLCSLIYFVSIVLFVKSPEDIRKVPVLFFLTNCISMTTLLILAKQTKPEKEERRFSLFDYFACLKAALPLGIGGLCTQMVIYLPPLLLEKFRTVDEVGIFGAVTRVISIFLIVDRIFSVIYISALSTAWNNNRPKAQKTVQNLLAIIITGGLMLSMLAHLLSGHIMTLLFGERFASGAPLLGLFCIFVTLTMIHSVVAYGLITLGSRKQYLVAALWGCLASVVSMSLFIPLFGVWGAGAGVVISEISMLTFSNRAFRQYCKLTLYRPLFQGLLFAIGSVASVTWLPVPLYIKIPLSSLIFILLSFSTGMISTRLLHEFFGSEEIEKQPF